MNLFKRNRNKRFIFVRSLHNDKEAKIGFKTKVASNAKN